MAKYCPNCGALSEESDKFCLKCGINFLENPPISFQSKPRISNTKILGAIIGVVVIIVVVSFLLFFVLNSDNGIMGETGDKNQGNDMSQSGNQNQDEDISKMLGEWNYDYENYSGTIIINSDNTIDVGYLGLNIEIGTWSLDGDEVCLEITQDLFDIGIEGSQCLSYYFSDEDNILTLYGFGIDDIVLTK